MTAILGPSGCGKTTLLNAIAGRMQSPNLQLTLSLNGKTVDPVVNRINVGFVPAHEALFPTDTPMEAFQFVSRLTLVNLSQAERNARVNEMLRVLRLETCAETYIGSVIVKGVSSGEKKRVSVGIELISQREVLFLDEPTTGLDSVTALELIELLRSIALSGVCIVAVIHQPSKTIWDLFDNALFMVNGQVVFNGPVSLVAEYFSSRGFVCPIEYNPPDYLMFLLQTLGEGAIADLIEENKPGTDRIRKAIHDSRKLYFDTLVEKGIKVFKRVGPAEQFCQLVAREYRATVRDTSLVALRLSIALVFAVIIGFLFFQVGQSSPSSPSHIGLVAALGIFAFVSSGQSLLLAYAAERPIALREFGSGFYSIWIYSISKDVLEYPVVVLSVLIYLTLGYLIGGLTGSFLLLLLGMLLTGLASAAVSFMLASVITDVSVASQIAAYVLVVQTLLSGFFISAQQIPWVLRWLIWISPLKYGLSILFIAEFNGKPGSAVFFASNDVNPSMILFYIFMLVGLILIVRVLGSVGLWWRTRKSTV